MKIYITPQGGGESGIMNKEKADAVKALKTSKGQIEGIIKMLEDGRYCIDVSNQIVAAQSLLKKANMLILKQHINHCVKDAFLNDSGDEKVDEIIELLGRLMGK
ncbi:DNA-binding transcriptional regulator, FrmR family [Clostridium acidisoli DSM 12555]|uniref:Copper-sensing transcriptional repressor CsoR n=2 Tax=Clostridium TaxID=1485 RepID=A0A1W1XPJ5_9CLOT|nr:DNA-binding transcriptional regulator, FrmR family [Clostridium acidisoli DSM 12555]